MITHQNGLMMSTNNHEIIANRSRYDEQGSIGIGAMIVFIALILVAAVASTVIIKTAEELQDRAEKTGDDTRDQISGKLLVTDAYIATINSDGPDDVAANADDVDVIATIVVIAKLASGSDNTLPSNMQWFVVCNNDGSYADATAVIGASDTDLSLTARAADAPLASGEQFAFTITLGNNGAGVSGNCMDAALVGTSLSVTLNVEGGGDTRLDFEIEEVSVGSKLI
jgi:flagellin FlaB